MKGFNNYFRYSFLSYLWMFILVGITNLVVFFSDESLDSVDLRYLNILLAICFLLFAALDYRKFRRTIYNFYEHYRESGQVDQGFIKEVGIGKLLVDMLSGLSDQYHQQLSKYNAELSEIDDYLNKWVHEVKIPISVLSVIAERLPYEDRQSVFYEIERIQHYIQQALYISRANYYQNDLHLEMVPLRFLIQEIVRRHKMILIQKNIQVDIHISEDVSVLTDRQWLSYILGQIIHNGAKYTKDQIDISLDQHDKGFVILIKDNGVGLLEGEINQVFNKGYVGKNGRSQSKSTGMGLYLSRKAAIILGAKLEVTSEVNQYTVFKLTLPLQDSNNVLKKQEISFM